MNRIFLGSCLVVLAMGTQAAKEYRDFTDTEGRVIRGCVTAYDAGKETVTIERDNRQTARVPIKIFSEADQAYFRDWEAARLFASPSSFKISAKRMRSESSAKKSSGAYSTKEIKDTHYEIQVQNRSATGLKGLQVEYCIYYEQEEVENLKEVCNQGVLHGEFAVPEMHAQEDKALLTGAVSIFREELDSSAIYVARGTGNPINVDNIQNGDVHGIWIRAHLKLPSGVQETREYCLPDSLSNIREWAATSKPAGANK